MEESILKFAKQFEYKADIQNEDGLHNKYQNYVLAGMGGSHLAADLLKTYKPDLNLFIHKDYGLPLRTLENTLYIACSYSGDTEEVMDFLDEAYSKGLDALVIASGGKLIEFAEKNNIPYIQVPNTGIQPRLAVGFLTLALASIITPEMVSELEELKDGLKPKDLQKEGEDLASIIENKIPIIYTSAKNETVAYNWKVKMNETGKMPAFYNIFPELNHNEMQGYESLVSNFHFIILHDPDDQARISKRMKITESLMEDKGYSVSRLYLKGNSRLERLFNSFILADWTALYLAKNSGREPEQVPLIQEFKKKIA